MSTPFFLQGHRGARGLKPENTLPSFEAAFDHGVDSVETDLHLTRDGHVVLCHDPLLSEKIFLPSPLPTAPSLAQHPPVSRLDLRVLQSYPARRNPDPARFPNQDDRPTALADWFAREQGIDPYAVPTLAQLFAFAAAYAGEPGARFGKTDTQQSRVRGLRFDLEIKRVPFHPEAINDGYNGRTIGTLEERLLADVYKAKALDRTWVRSFDHRCVHALIQREPCLLSGILVAGTAPVDPAELAHRAGARAYYPSYEFVDEDLVRQLHDSGLEVVPWTVNDTGHWTRLLDWGVDGITTDFPDRFAAWLVERAK